MRSDQYVCKLFVKIKMTLLQIGVTGKQIFCAAIKINCIRSDVISSDDFWLVRQLAVFHYLSHMSKNSSIISKTGFKMN